MRSNYHTHTYRCHHASQDPDRAYVDAAIEAGYTLLGFSDHTPWPYESGYIPQKQRMHIDALPEYKSSIEELKETCSGKIRILTGLECEFFPQYIPWLREKAREFDYLLLGNHFGLSDEHGEMYYALSSTREQLEEYTKYTISGMQTGLFSCLCHPELPLGDYPRFDDTAKACAHAICQEAEKLGMPLEYNLYGVVKKQAGKFLGLGYPAREFWEVARQYRIRAIVGVDAHKPGHLLSTDLMDRATAFLTALGIPVIDEL